MLSYFNLNNRSEKTRDTTSKIPKGIEESIATASRLKKLAVELEESSEPFAPVFVDKASSLVIDASRLAKDASGLVRNDATAKGYEDLAEKVKSLSRKTLRVEDVAKSKDASGLVRDASGLVRDASGLVRDASGLVRDAEGDAEVVYTVYDFSQYWDTKQTVFTVQEPFQRDIISVHSSILDTGFVFMFSTCIVVAIWIVLSELGKGG